jgi:hypothetical protein
MAGLMVVVLGVGMAVLIAPHIGTVLSASSNAANLDSACTTPSPTDSATSATAAATTTSTGAQAGALPQRRRHRRRPAPPATPTPTASATTPAGTPTPSASATTPMGTPTPTVSASTPVGTPTPTVSASMPAGTPTPTTSATTPTGTPTPTTSASTTPTATPTPCPSATATDPPVTANVNCDIIVPANPLTAQGLATPYQLTGTDGATPAASGCNMANSASLGAFVEATILDPATGALSVYDPLVITQGSTPAAAPVLPTLPADAVVTVDIGFNGTDLTQVGATSNALQQGNCVDGLNGSVFGQVSFCNGTAFFQAAARAEASGKLVVPSAGVSPKTGQACPTTRDFTVVDQDPSDNVTTTYLITATGQTAQFNTANVGALAGATEIVNGSDNKLLAAFLDPTLGCTPLEAPDLGQGGTPDTSQALNELSAAKSQAAPIALIPENDEMVLVNDAISVAKTNLYRSNVGQPAVSAANDASSSPANFCQDMVNVQTPFLSTNQALLATDGSPVPAVGNNLLTFLANRLNMSFSNLGCGDFGLTNPVTVTLDGNGVATAATFNTTQQTATGTAAPTPPPPGHRKGRRHHTLMDPSGE